MSTPAAAKQVIEGEVVVSLDKRRGGRPKGLPKTGGRTKGTPNKLSMDQRERIAKAGDPIGFLIAVMRGRGAAVKGMHITPEMRVAVALRLFGKLMPDPKDDGTGSGPGLTLDDLANRSGSHPNIELGRRMAYVITCAEREMDEQAAAADPYQSRGVAPPEPDEPEKVAQLAPVSAPEPAPEPAPQPKPAWRHNPLLHGRSAILDD